MHTNSPLVSIITPCYNYGKYLSETLNSLISQNYSNWECIIVNDGSTDNTEDIAKAYSQLDKRFIYISQKNTGLPGARNTALRKAQGKYIQLLDADDFLEEDKLSLQVAYFEQNPSTDLIYSKMLGFYDNTKDRAFFPLRLPHHCEVSGKNENVINALIPDNFFLPGCVILKKTLYEKVGDFNEALYGLEDWEYWSRAALLGFEFYLDKRIGTKLLVRDHDSNMSKVREKMLLSRVIARKSIIDTAIVFFNNKMIKFSNEYFNKLIKKHRTLESKEIYEYNIHHGNKILALKELVKYSYNSGNIFYPIRRFITSLTYRFLYKH